MNQSTKRVFFFLTILVMLIAMMPIAAFAAPITQGSQGGYPFLLGAARGPANEPVPLMSYTMGSKTGSVVMDGSITDFPLTDLFAQFETRPDSDHPDGIAYIWVYDDASNVYFVLDWTSDDTYDFGEDYFTVFLDDGTGLKSYTQHTAPVGGAYGVEAFGPTARADYDHMWYAIAVPKSDISGDTLKVGFEMYGTVIIGGTISWATTPVPTTTVGTPVDFEIAYDLTGAVSPKEYAMVLFSYKNESDLDAISATGYSVYFENGVLSVWDGFATVPYQGDLTVLGYAGFTTAIPGSGEVTITHTFDTAGSYKLAVRAFDVLAGSVADFSTVYANPLYGFPPIITTLNVVDGHIVFAPVLSNPRAQEITKESALVVFGIDQAAQVHYAVYSGTAAGLSAAQVIAGAGAVESGSLNVASPGSDWAFKIAGLDPASTYTVYLVATNDNGQSNVIAVTFTTSAATAELPSTNDASALMVWVVVGCVSAVATSGLISARRKALR